MAHFEETKIFVAQFIVMCRGHFKGSHIFVAHFDSVCDVMMTKLVGLASELMAAKVISKKKKVIVSSLPMMASPRTKSELICKGK